MLGQRVDGKYEVTRLLGEGGMGAVYEATHTGTGRRVALKVISGANLARSPEIVARFHREARVVGAIDTQHIVQVLDTGTDAATGFPFIVMEFLSGGDLAQTIERLGPLPPDVALRLTAQACVGLQKAHEAHVIHRDIKPANLYLARRDAGEVLVKLLDFGIAKVKEDPQSSSDAKLTRTGSMLGSPSYMSPEQAKGLKTIDHRTDVWSLGAVLYEALTGRTPHHEVETIGQLIIAICAQPPPPVEKVAPWVPPHASAIVSRALQLEPDARFPSAAAMLDAITAALPNGWSVHERMLVPLAPEQRALVHSRPSRGLTSSGFDATIPVAAVALTGGVPDGGSSQAGTSLEVAPPRASRAPWALAGAAVALLAIGAGAYGVTRGSAERSAPAAGGLVAEPQPSVAPSPVDSAAPAVDVAASAASRDVKLAVVPANAVVEIDGAAVKAEGGAVTLSGALGSVHRVKLTVGARTSTAEVVIAESGPVPPKVELGVTPAPRSAPTPAATAGPAAAPPPPTPGPAAARPAPKATGTPGATIDKKFE